jgi:D-cysteine desulfhydrase
MDYIGRKIHSGEYDSLVTTGGIHSNHCRAVAVFAAQHKLNCTLVLHGDMERFNIESGNAKIIRLSGAKIVFANQPSDIGGLMDQAMDDFKESGYKPYYIWGGGHTMQGGLAYIEAIKSISEYSASNNWIPDNIFLASGTGSTQAGIMAGLDKYGLDKTNVIGISVGREALQAESVVQDFYNQLCSNYHIQSTSRKAVVLDEYLCGGYGKSNKELDLLSFNSIKNYGFTLDTTYSGKAFYGMLDNIKTNNLQGNFLFWHTGGIFNFLAQ